MTSHQPGVQPGANPNPKRTRAWAAVILLIVVAILGSLVWQRFHPASQSAPAVAQAVVQAASAPASAASAATQVAQPKAAPAAVEAKTYTVKPGDTLGKRFGKSWKAVCDLNTELMKGNCNHLEIGWVLNLPEGVEPLEDEALPAKKAVKVLASQPTTTGEFLWKKVGGAPLRGCGNKDAATINEEAWADYIRQGLMTEAERDELRELTRGMIEPNILLTSSEGRVELKPGDRFPAVSFCSKNGQATSRTNVLAAWDAEKTGPVFAQSFKLKSSVPDADGMVTEWLWVRSCHNWVPRKVKLPVAPKLTPPPPPAPLPVIEPDPPAEPTPLPPAPAPVPPATVTDKGLCDWIDPNASLGQEHEPSHNDGDVTHSNFATVSLYCMRPFEAADGATGSHGFGGKVTASDWRGRVNHREGHFSGWNAMGGPSYKRVMDEGYDWEVSLAAGHQRDRFSQGQYASQRDFNLVGMTAGYNDYRRRLAGEEWLPEKQFFGALTLPVSRNVSHSWNGQPIADTEELSRFRFGVQAGYRQWLHETSDSVVLPYFQAGIFVQDPTSSSLSLRLGVSDPARIVGVGAGIDQDLQNGGHPVFAWGWWADPIQGFRVGRAKYRKHQVITDAAKRGITVEEKDGYIQSIRFSQDWLNSQGLQLVPTTPTTVTE